MATKPRHLKDPIQLWIWDKRKEHGLTTAEVAALTGVKEATARGWESRGRPSQEALAILERRYGEMAPPDRAESLFDRAIIEVVRELVVKVDVLVTEMRDDRERGIDAATAILRAAQALGERPTPEGSPGSNGRPAPRETTGSK